MQTKAALELQHLFCLSECYSSFSSRTGNKLLLCGFTVFSGHTCMLPYCLAQTNH